VLRPDPLFSLFSVEAVNISFPQQWCIEYGSKNYVRSDPIVKENFTNYKLQRWSEAKKKIPCNESQKKIASLCIDFGMKDGYTFGSRPLHTEKNGSMFCYSGSSMENDERTAALLECVTPHLHLALSHVYDKRQSDLKKAVISDREKEVLCWLQRGKSSWDISVILGISERTVNYHVYNIMQKLDVVNRSQALAVATRLGLIEMG
jgi:DNA-binding CsgD family transcriptional regulator